MSLASEFIGGGKALALAAKGQACPICLGSGVSTIGVMGMQQIGAGRWACVCEAGRQALAAHQASRGAAEIGAMLAGAQIPAKFAGYDFESFRARTVKSVEKVKGLRMAREWTQTLTLPSPAKAGEGEKSGEGVRPWLFLYGKTGRGKTGLGVAALKALIAAGHAGRFVASFDMFEEMKQRFGGDVEAYTQALADVELLMLDEIVPTQITDWRRGVLFELLWRRDADRKLTIMTTAAGTDVLTQAVTEAGWRRIRENSVMVELGGNEINYGM
ncbi:MAG: ATP-binding protein [Acidithiobacillus sp.]|nr:ATP-binding protein [Acidithiobacillus sp.]